MKKELKTEEARPIFLEARKRGIRDEETMLGLISRGYSVRGADVSGLRDYMKERETLNPVVQQISEETNTASLISPLGKGVTGETVQEERTKGTPKLQQFGQGLVKSSLETNKGLGEIGEEIAQSTVGKLIEPVSNFLRRSLGKDEISEEEVRAITQSDLFTEGTEANRQFEELVRANTPSEAGGKFVGELLQFAIPSNKITRSLKGSSLATRTGIQALSSAGITTAQQGELGKDALINAGIDIGFPVLGKAISKTAKLLKRGTEEVIGNALTGTSQETIEIGLQKVLESKDSRKAFVKALRTELTPEQITNTLKDNIDEVSSRASNAYSQSLKDLGQETVQTKDLLNKASKKLNDFGVQITPEGLDFSKSKLRTVPQAKSKVENAYAELISLENKGTATISEIDTTRQAIQNIKLVGDDPSARAANALVTDMVSQVRDTGSKVKGYKKMLDDFSSSAEFLSEIEKGLSTGDKKTVDQTFRRMVTAFKTNNEQRMKLVKELDEVTDGFVSAKIAGQQLSEALPRGMIGRLVAPMIGGAALSGGLSLNLLPILLLASPRVIGETINTIGMSAEKTKLLRGAITEAQKVLADSLGVTPSNITKVLLNNAE